MTSDDLLPDRHSTAAPARHCPELLRKGPGPDELMALLTRTGDRLGRRLSGALAPLLGGEAPPITCTPARASDYAALRNSVARLAANSLMTVGNTAGADASDDAAPLLVSIEAEPVLRIVDRAFGGKGEAPAPLPHHFPMAAEMMIARLETLIAGHLTAAIAAITAMPGLPDGPRHEGGPVPIAPLRRDGSMALLAPFAEGQKLVQITLEVDDGSVLPWLITLAMPVGTCARLFGYPDPTLGVLPDAPPRRPSRADAMPFGDVPMTLSAVVIDMRVPFPVIAGLSVGQLLPVTVARQIPLRVVGHGHDPAGHTIATGVVGAVDDRVAVQLTKAF